MCYIEWDDSLNVGIETIDSQHRHWLDLVNSAYDCVVGKTHENFGPILEEAVEYLEYHFKEEETMMNDCGFPDFHEHQIEHEILREEFQILKKMFQEKHPDVVEQITGIMNRWYREHLKIRDMEFFDFYKSREMKPE